MEFFLFVFIFLALGAILGVIWKWRVWLLFPVVSVTSGLAVLYETEFPPRATIFHDVWSFLYFMVITGAYMGLVVLAGASGALLGLLARKKLGWHREISESAVPPKL